MGHRFLLETLWLPFAQGQIAWPEQAQSLFLRARAGLPLDSSARNRLVCVQSFKPWADELSAAGYLSVPGKTAGDGSDAKFPLVLLLPPRQREEARALMAQALRRSLPGGVIVMAMANHEGARSGEADLRRLAGAVHSLSKHKARVFWACNDSDGLKDRALIDDWAMLDVPRPVVDGRFLSRPGLFAWSRIDAASALLARCLPSDLAGHGADLGAGFGYLASEVLARCPGVIAIDLYEAEARGLELARQNLETVFGSVGRVRCDYLWHDVTAGLLSGRRYDFIVSNPPFHQGHADQPEIGQAFIRAASRALLPGGRFWLVANRHLPYESVLGEHFGKVRLVCSEQGYKVIEAIAGRLI